MSLPRLEHSARLVLYVSGTLIGCVTGFNFNSSTNRSNIRGIDLQYVQELGASTVEINGAISVLRPISIGGSQGNGLVAQFADIPYEKYVTLLILDIVTDQTFFKADYCTINNESWNVPTKSYVTGTISFSGISWSNESSGQ